MDAETYVRITSISLDAEKELLWIQAQENDCQIYFSVSVNDTSKWHVGDEVRVRIGTIDG